MEMESLETWLDEDRKRIYREEAESATALMKGIQIAINVGYAATIAASDTEEQLGLAHRQMMEELRNLRDCFAPGEEIRASAARLRHQQKVLIPVMDEHRFIAIEAGKLFDALSIRYSRLVFPVRGSEFRTHHQMRA